MAVPATTASSSRNASVPVPYDRDGGEIRPPVPSPAPPIRREYRRLAMTSPPGLRSLKIEAGGQALGEYGTAETLADHLGRLRSADVIQSAAKLLHWLEASDRDWLGAAQRELAASLPEPFASRVLGGLDAGGAGGGFDAIVHPAQLLALMKLAPRLCVPGPPSSFDDGNLYPHFLLALLQVNDVRQLVLGDNPIQNDMGAAIYAVRGAEVGAMVSPTVTAGRAFHLWLDSRLPWPAHIEDPNSFAERTLGVELATFVAATAAPAIARSSVDLEHPGEMPFDPATYFRETRIDVDIAVGLLDYLTYQVPGGAFDITDQVNYWSFIDFAARPLLRCGQRILVPCSFRYGLERATTGLFWMLHGAVQGEVEPLTTHFGRMFEDYCLRVAERLCSDLVTVAGEISYSREKNKVLSSDVIITAGSVDRAPARVFVECRAGRPSSRVFAKGDVEAFSDYVDDLLGKLDQLDRVIRDHIDGAFGIDGDLAGPNDAYVPMLVVDKPFRWSLALRRILDAGIARGNFFRDHRVTKPIVCDVEAFDHLVHACEEGADLLDLLRSYLASDRRESLESHIDDAMGELRPSSFTLDGSNQMHELVMSTLF